MTAEPIRFGTWGRAAPVAMPRRLRVTPPHKATAVALVFSALLHGALAATILMWPDAPVPHAAGDAIVVSLVTMAPTEGGGPAGAESQAGEKADDASRADDTATAATMTPSLSAAAEPPEPAPPQKEAVIADLALETAAGEDSPPAATDTAPSAVPPAVAKAPFLIPPPPRRPAMLARAEPRTTRPPIGSANPPRPVPTPAPPADTSSAVPDGGGVPAESAKASPTPAIGTAASAPAGGGSPGPMTTAALGAPVIGPHFAMGTALNPRPRYPLSARRNGLEGRVVLRVLVEADGKVRSVDVVRSSTHAVLDGAAVEALRRWRFDPARQSGVPVASWIDIPVTFRLRD